MISTTQPVDSHPVYRVSMAVKWLDAPEDHDFDAAADYLSLVAEADVVAPTVEALKVASPEQRKAKDILRAARLALLPATNVRVKSDLAKIDADKKLSPILLVRGKALDGVALEIADGYHRVCASYLTDENTPIPCRLVSWQTPG
jgi:hypothetical protein